MPKRRAASVVIAQAFVTTWMLANTASASPPEIVPDLGGGIERTHHDIASTGQASSVDLNPALLRDAGRFHLQILGYLGPQQARMRSGIGGFASLSLFDSVTLALGLSRLTTPNGYQRPSASNAPPLAVTRTSFGLAVGSPRSVSFGVGLHGLFADQKRLRAVEFELGTLVRATRFASLGLVAGLFPASLQNRLGLRAEVRGTAELALRPLGNDWLELAGQLRVYADRSVLQGDRRLDEHDIYPRFRLVARHRQVRIYGELEQTRQTSLIEIGGAPTDRFWRGSMGLEWLLGAAQVGTGLHLGASTLSPGGSLMIGVGGREAQLRNGPVGARRQVLRLSSIEDAGDLAKILLYLDERREAGARTHLVVVLDQEKLPWASAYELRTALQHIRAAHGRVTAYIVDASLSTYYVASVANKIVQHPTGTLDLAGLQATRLFFGQALQKLGVHATSVHTGDYKSANERWTRSERSPSDRAQTTALFEHALTVFRQAIADSRKLDRNKLAATWASNDWGPTQALAAGLIDEVNYLDRLVDDDDFDVSDVNERTRVGPEHWTGNPYVAVVVLEGMLLEGESLSLPLLGVSRLGAKTVAKQLRELAADPNCKAIVLRVESPGGSVTASEEVWHAVDLLATKHRKSPRKAPPVVVSMANVAASGGYYLSVATPHIWASPLTLTGSIGVTSVHFDGSQLMGKLGIHADRLLFGGLGAASPFFPLDDAALLRLRSGVERAYQLFLQRVAMGRRLSVAQVRELASGHVYSGEHAYRLGLVSHLGTLTDAVRCARAQATRLRGDAPRIVVLTAQEGLLALLNQQRLGDVHLRRAHAPTWPKALLERLPDFAPWLGAAVSLAWLGSDRPLAVQGLDIAEATVPTFAPAATRTQLGESSHLSTRGQVR